jgi:hypothetical protein
VETHFQHGALADLSDEQLLGIQAAQPHLLYRLVYDAEPSPGCLYRRRVMDAVAGIDG